MSLSDKELEEIEQDVLDSEVDAMPNEWGCTVLIFFPVVSLVGLGWVVFS